MDTTTVKRTLFGNKNITKLYSVLCGALLKEHAWVKVITKDETGNHIQLTIHRWNQQFAPDRVVLGTWSQKTCPWLDEGAFQIMVAPSHTTDGFSYRVRIKRGRKLPYLDLEPLNQRFSSRSMEMGIHDWFERVLGDYLRPVRRCLRVKEELMMNRWHPDRVFRLLEMGIDEEDM